MNKNKQMDYLIPTIEVQVIEVEQGFSLSNMEQIGGEKEEIEW